MIVDASLASLDVRTAVVALRRLLAAHAPAQCIPGLVEVPSLRQLFLPEVDLCHIPTQSLSSPPLNSSSTPESCCLESSVILSSSSSRLCFSWKSCDFGLSATPCKLFIKSPGVISPSLPPLTSTSFMLDRVGNKSSKTMTWDEVALQGLTPRVQKTLRLFTVVGHATNLLLCWETVLQKDKVAWQRQSFGHLTPTTKSWFKRKRFIVYSLLSSLVSRSHFPNKALKMLLGWSQVTTYTLKTELGMETTLWKDYTSTVLGQTHQAPTDFGFHQIIQLWVKKLGSNPGKFAQKR